MTSTCILCRQNKNIIYWDYDFQNKYSIRLCYQCLKFLNWETEIKQILPQLNKCSECDEKYLSKKPNPIKCGICWGKLYPQPQQSELLIPSAPIQKGVIDYV
jgi:hypothetical protein